MTSKILERIGTTERTQSAYEASLWNWPKERGSKDLKKSSMSSKLIRR